MACFAINFGALLGFYGNMKIRLFVVYMTDFLIFFPIKYNCLQFLVQIAKSVGRKIFPSEHDEWTLVHELRGIQQIPSIASLPGHLMLTGSYVNSSTARVVENFSPP